MVRHSSYEREVPEEVLMGSNPIPDAYLKCKLHDHSNSLSRIRREQYSRP